MAAGAAIFAAAMAVAALTAAAKTAMTPKPEDDSSLQHYGGGFLQNFFKALPFASIGAGVSAAGQTPAHWTSAAGEPIGPYTATAGSGAGASGGAAGGALSEGARSAALESAVQSPESAQLLGDVDVVTEMPTGQYYGYPSDYGTYQAPSTGFKFGDLGDWDWWAGKKGGGITDSLYDMLGVDSELAGGASKYNRLGGQLGRTPSEIPEVPNPYLEQRLRENAFGGRLPQRRQGMQQAEKFWIDWQKREEERRRREQESGGQFGSGLYGGYNYG